MSRSTTCDDLLLELNPGVAPSLVDGDLAREGIRGWDDPNPADFSARQASWRDITVAMVGSERLYHGLTPICDTIVLSRANWRQAASHITPDLVLIDSFVRSWSGDWHLGVFGGDSAEWAELESLIEAFQQQGVPVVFWNTFDASYAGHLSQIAGRCDFRYYSDHRLDGRGEDAKLYPHGWLPPACAPARQSRITPLPLAAEEDAPLYRPRIAPIVFDGWASYLRNKYQLGWLDRFGAAELTLVESRYKLFRNQLAGTGSLAGTVLGCVSRPSLWSIWRRAEIALFSDVSLASAHSRAWDMREANACGAAIFHHGERGDDSDDFGIVTVGEPDSIVAAMQDLLAHPTEMVRRKQMAWRHALSANTFSHRLQAICDDVGIDVDFLSRPPVSVLSVTFRLDYITRIIRQYDAQTYDDKELVLVVNSNSVTHDEVAGIIGDRSDIRFAVVPAERVEAGSLNHGICVCRGTYIVKMDDDDIYGPHYVSDMILHADALDLDLFGKANRFIYFSDLDEMHMRARKRSMARIRPERLLADHIGGATLSGKRSFFQTYPYPEFNFSATDTHYYSNLDGRIDGRFASLDDSGFVYWRRKPEEHSWQMNNDQLRAGMTFIKSGIAEDILD